MCSRSSGVANVRSMGEDLADSSSIPRIDVDNYIVWECNRPRFSSGMPFDMRVLLNLV